MHVGVGGCRRGTRHGVSGAKPFRDEPHTGRTVWCRPCDLTFIGRFGANNNKTQRPLSKTQTQSLDFVVNRLFMKLSDPCDIGLVKQCQEQFFMFKRNLWPCTRLFYDTLCTYSIIVGFSLLRVCFSAFVFFVYACSINVLVKKDWYIIQVDTVQHSSVAARSSCTNFVGAFTSRG